jgi:ribosomal protein L16 Arg81 hydroxylase
MWKQDGGLAELLAPLSFGEFAADYLGQKPLIVHRNNADFYRGLCGVEQFEDALVFTRPKPGSGLRLVNSENGDASARLMSPLWAQEDGTAPHLALAHSAFEDGDTLLLSSVQHRIRAVAFLCRMLSRDLSGKVWANAYLTPPRAQGFQRHFDRHDTIVLQLDGRKTWQLFKQAAEFPVGDRQLGHAAFNEQVDDELDATEPPTHEFVLQQGDLVYIPRGVPHQARTGPATSLHLTLGIKLPHWSDLLERVVAVASRHDSELRRPLPLTWMSEGAEQELGLRIQSLLSGLAEASVSQAIDSLAAAMLAKSRPLPMDQLASLTRLDMLDEDTHCELVPGAYCRVARLPGGGVRAYFPGNYLGADSAAEPALRFVAKTTARFQARDLPGALGLDARLKLVRALVRCGLLRVATEE